MPTVKRLKDPADYVSKWERNVKNVGKTNYLEGIEKPKRNPIARAIECFPKHKQKLTEALDEERQKKVLQTVSMEDWYKYAKEIGAAEYTQSTIGRKPKAERFWKGWQPILLGIVEDLDAMSVETDTDRENKMIENKRKLQAKKGEWRG